MLQSFRYNAEKVEQEIDIGFEASKVGRVFAVQMHKVGKKHNLTRNPKFPLYIFLDPGRGKGNAFYIGWAQFNPDTGRYECIREVMSEGRSAYWFRAFVTGKEKHILRAKREGLTDEEEEFCREVNHPMWRPDDGFGDPLAIRAKTAAAIDSVQGIFNKAGIPLRGDPKYVTFPVRIEATRRVLLYTDINPSACPKLYNGLMQIAWPEQGEKSRATQPPAGYVHHPMHSHPVASYEQLACHDPCRIWTVDGAMEAEPEEDRFDFMNREDLYDKLDGHYSDDDGSGYN
jgi:hypothetical protein